MAYMNDSIQVRLMVGQSNTKGDTIMSTTNPTRIAANSSNKKIEVKVPSVSVRTWKTIDDLGKQFTNEEIVQMVHRYCDQQDHAKSYRQRRAAKIKKLMELADEHGLMDELEGEDLD